MARVAAIGEPLRIEMFCVAGALAIPVADAEAARAAWRDLPGDVAVVLLTESAAGWIGPACVTPAGSVLTVVMPS